MRYLIDMDGVLADFDREVLTTFRERYPDKPHVPLEEQTQFYYSYCYPEELRPLVLGISRERGFFRRLPVIEGGIEALEYLRDMGHEVFLCTAPLPTNPYCIPEKLGWLEEHAGEFWARRMIATLDKTVVTADVLVDDKPEVTGAQDPHWEHVLYHKPYNSHVRGKRRLTWANWRDVLGV